MPFIVAVTPQIPPANKNTFLAAWPEMKADIAKQPGVLRISGGEVIGENFSPVTDFKFFQTIAFATPEDEHSFTNSAWAKDHFEQAKVNMAGPPTVRKFQTGDFPDAAPRALTQFSFVELAHESKHDEAKEAWADLVAAIGDGKLFGGPSADDGPSTGMGVLGWDSREQAMDAYKRPEVAAAWDKYKSLGKTTTILVKLEA